VNLIHDCPLSSVSWDDEAIMLAGYRAIAYGGPGFGRSTQSWIGYDALADDRLARRALRQPS